MSRTPGQTNPWHLPGLTKKQFKFLLIAALNQKFGMLPTFRFMQAKMGYRAVHSAHSVMQSLVKKGLVVACDVRRDPQSRLKAVYRLNCVIDFSEKYPEGFPSPRKGKTRRQRHPVHREPDLLELGEKYGEERERTPA